MKSRTHIYAFRVAFSAVTILILMLLVILLSQNQAQPPTAKKQPITTTVSKQEPTNAVHSASRFLISHYDVDCTKMTTNTNPPINTCKGDITLVADIKEGDPAMYTLHVNDKTKLFQGEDQNDLSLLYRLKDEQIPIIFTSDEDRNALTISYE